MIYEPSAIDHFQMSTFGTAIDKTKFHWDITSNCYIGSHKTGNKIAVSSLLIKWWKMHF